MNAELKTIAPKGENRLYKKIEKYIVEYIKSNNLTADDSLPSEREIGRVFKASQIPVRRAIGNLEKEGILKRIKGKGAVVNKNVRSQVKTGKIGIFYCHNDIRFFVYEYYASMLGGIDQEARKEKMNLLFQNIMLKALENPVDTIQRLYDDLDGYILVGLHMAVYRKIKTTLESLKKPVVVLAYDILSDVIDMVSTDNRKNTYRLIDYLVSKGHKRIACVYRQPQYQDEPNPNYITRERAYEDALRQHGIPVDPKLVHVINAKNDKVLDDYMGLPVYKKMLAMDSPPTAIFFPAGSTVEHFYELAPKLSVRIPEDISVAAYDGSGFGDLAPRLTCNDTSLAEVGRAGVKLLLEKLNDTTGVPRSARTVLVDGSLIEGKSVKQIN